MKTIAAALLLAACCLSPNDAWAQDDYSWRQPQAEVLANGDLTWKPQPFTFE